MSHHPRSESQRPPPVAAAPPPPLMPGRGHPAQVPQVGTYVPPHEEHLVLRHAATEPMPHTAANPVMSPPALPPAPGYVQSPPHIPSPGQIPSPHHARGPAGPPSDRGPRHSSRHGHSSSHGRSPNREKKPPSGHSKPLSDSHTHYSTHKDIPYPIPHTKGDPALSTRPLSKQERKRDAKDGGLDDHAELALEGVSKVLRALADA